MRYYVFTPIHDYDDSREVHDFDTKEEALDFIDKDLIFWKDSTRRCYLDDYLLVQGCEIPIGNC